MIASEHLPRVGRPTALKERHELAGLKKRIAVHLPTKVQGWGRVGDKYKNHTFLDKQANLGSRIGEG